MQKLNKILMIVLLGILLVSSVTAYDTSKIVFCLDFEADTNDYNKINNFTNSGIEFISGKVGNSGNCTSADSDYAYSAYNNLLTQMSDFSVVGWVAWQSSTNWHTFYEETDDDGDNVGFNLGFRTVGNVISLYQRFSGTCDVGTCNLQDDTTMVQGAWYMVGGVHDSNGGGTLYINGTNTTTGINAVAVPNEPGEICRTFGSTYADVFVDTLIGYNGTLSDVDMEELYNSGDGMDCATVMGGSPSSQPTMTLYTNLTNNTDDWNEQTITFNYSAAFADNTVTVANVSFFQQGIHNITLLDIDLATQNVFNITLPTDFEGYYNVSFNASNFESNDSIGVYIYNVDLVSPTLSMTSIVNDSSFDLQSNVDLNISGTCADTNLFSCNMTIYLLNAGARVSQFNTNFTQNITSSSYTINLSNKSTDLIYPGGYEIYMEAWDDHTALEITEYDNTKLSDGYNIDNVITITSPDLVDMTLVKEIDRYSFDMEFTKTTPTIYIESDGVLEYRTNSKYKGHFVDWDNKKWIDFEDTTGSNVKVTRVTDYKYKIEPLSELKELTFNSIGDLNQITSSWYFNTTNLTREINITSTFNASVYENTSQTFNLLLNWTNFNITYTDAYISYNGSAYTVTTTDSSYTGSGSSQFEVNLTIPFIEHNTTDLEFIWYYNLTTPNNVSTETYPLTSNTFNATQGVGFDMTQVNMDKSIDGNLSSYTLFTGAGSTFGYWNITKPVRTNEIVEINITMKANFTGTIPNAGQLDFFCMDEPNDFTGQNLDLIDQVIGEGTYNFTLNVTNSFYNCFNSSDSNFYLVISHGTSYDTYLYELTEFTMLYNGTSQRNLTQQQTVSYNPSLYHYNITAINNITTNTITNFNVTFSDGTVIGTNDSYIHRISTVAVENLTFRATDYADTNASDHNTSGDLQVSMFPTNSLFFFVYDEQTNTLITDRNVTVKVVNYDNVSTTYTTDTGSTFQSGFVPGDYEITYGATNYTTRSYYVTIAGSDTQSVELFLLTDTDTDHAYKNFEVIDESASSISNATVQMQRYYYVSGAEGEWKTVEMSKSNDEGKGFFFVELYDVPYRFVIVYLGSTVSTTAQTKLDDRDLFFPVTLLTTGLDSYYNVQGIDTSLDYVNTTKIWTYNYNAVDTTIDNARLVVEERTDSTITIIHNATDTSQSGGLTFNLTAYSGVDASYYAYGYVTTSSDSYQHLVELDSIAFNELYLNYGLLGLYLSFLIIGTMAFAGLKNPTIAIAFALFGLLITTFSGMMYLQPIWVVGIIIVGLIFIFNIKT